MSYVDSPKFKLFQSLKRGKIDDAKKWLNNGCNISDVTENDKWSYLHKSLQSTNSKVPNDTVQFLIEEGLDVNAVDSYGYTPLIFAVRQQNLPAIKLLLENGAEKRINHCPEDGSTPLKMVFKKKPYSPEIVKTLLEAGADPDAKGEGGCSFRYLVSILADMPPEIPELLKLYPEK